MAATNNIILAPVITEKSYARQDSGIYTFWVSATSSKDQIAFAFKSIYGHQPVSVNVLTVKGKKHTNWNTRKTSFKPDRKKAIVTIGKDKKIESLTLKTK